MNKQGGTKTNFLISKNNHIGSYFTRIKMPISKIVLDKKLTLLKINNLEKGLDLRDTVSFCRVGLQLYLLAAFIW